MGYSVTADRRRRGYATEAGRALAEWACCQPDVRLIVASCDSSNLPSIRTLERVGFNRVAEDDGEMKWSYGNGLEGVQ